MNEIHTFLSLDIPVCIFGVLLRRCRVTCVRSVDVRICRSTTRLRTSQSSFAATSRNQPSDKKTGEKQWEKPSVNPSTMFSRPRHRGRLSHAHAHVPSRVLAAPSKSHAELSSASLSIHHRRERSRARAKFHPSSGRFIHPRD